MRFFDFFAPHRSHRLVPTQTAFWSLTVIAFAFGAGATNAQTSAQPTPPSPGTVVHAGPQWHELSPAQQKILQPLAGAWNSAMPERKNKWLALAQNYPNLGPAEQMKLQSRMAEWAALKPQERERARLNFAETKKLAPTERSANWEAYQALSAEEKQKLVEKARAKPPGAAIAPKPVAPDTLTTVPLTRRTTEQNKPAVVAKPVLDKHTLLPVAPRPAQGASTPSPQ